VGLIRQAKGIVEVVKPVFSLVESFSSSIENDTFNYEEPRTEFKKWAEQLRHALAQVDVSALQSTLRPVLEPLVKRFLRRLARPSNLARIRNALRGSGDELVGLAASALVPEESEPIPPSPRAQQWLAYLDELHARVPYATAAIIKNLPIWKTTFLWDVSKLVHLMRQARNTTGEKRASALKELARHVTENIHQRYVHGVEFTERLSQGRKLPKCENHYGGAINGLKDWGSPAAKRFIHPDAAVLRNAASHVDRWHDDVDAETIVIHDANDPTRQLRYTFDQMYSFCETLAEDAAAFGEALFTHVMKLGSEVIVETQVLELMLSDFTPQPLSPEAIEEEKRKIAERFEPLKERLSTIQALPQKN
jgi:hypothetical protein